MEKGIKSLRVKIGTHKRLSKIGKFGESHDGLLNRIIDIYLHKEKKK